MKNKTKGYFMGHILYNRNNYNDIFIYGFFHFNMYLR